MELFVLPSRSRRYRRRRAFATHSAQTNERTRTPRAALPTYQPPTDGRFEAVRSMLLNQREHIDLG